ncbi:conserved hypothetical protein [[Clostridium] ultunense Esp]|nr:conserved hypothetical protein [[Clostridium] ultunense Esp]
MILIQRGKVCVPLKLHDALFNWLQIKVVAEARPEDHAASETLQFFSEILREDHQVTHLSVTKEGDEAYEIEYVREGKREKERFDAYRVDELLVNIMNEPKYNQ